MINFIIYILGYNYGNTKRYEDFFKYLNDNNFKYKNTNIIDKNNINFIDLVYESQNDYKHYKLNNSNNYFFIGGEIKLIELFTYNLKPHNLITHNLYYAKKLNAIFLPMFLYENTARVKRDDIKYKYGFFISTEDPNSYILEKIIKEMNIDKNEILLMDRNNLYKDYNVTTNNKFFYNSIESFVDIACDTSNRHIMSRTYLELINNNIPIKSISFENNKLISFLGFKHIKYELEKEYNNFNLYNVIYNKKYFKTNTYSKYIIKTLNTFEIDLRNYIEDYAD